MSDRANTPLFVSIAPPLSKQWWIVKACAEKAYPLGEGPKQTRGGGQIWAQKMPGSKDKKESKVNLGSAPSAVPTKMPTGAAGAGSKAQKSLQLINEMMGALK